MKKIAMIVLVTAALGFTAAPPAHSGGQNDLIVHLAQEFCESGSNPFKNGCYAYLESRIGKAGSQSLVRESCKTQCEDWYGNDAVDKKRCDDGCGYIYGYDGGEKFIIKLAITGCRGQSRYHQIGCSGYLEARFDMAKNPIQAWKWCKNTKCYEQFTGDDPLKKDRCDDGCDYLVEKEQ